MQMRVSFLLAAALGAAACSDNPARFSPVAPTGALAASAASSGEPQSTAIVAPDGPVSDPGKVARWAASTGWDALEFEVHGGGEITAVATTCPTGTFTILGVPVTVTSSTMYENGSCAALAVGRRVDVRAMLSITGGMFTVTATRVEFVDAREAEVEGRVVSVTGVCPALRLVLDRGQVVLTNATTVFDPSTACALIAMGVEIEARGTRNAAGELVAARVEIERRGEREIEREGPITALAGACPDVTVSVGGVRFMTNAGTRFDDGTCANLMLRVMVRIEGLMQSDGTVLATRVKFRDDDDDGDLDARHH